MFVCNDWLLLTIPLQAMIISSWSTRRDHPDSALPSTSQEIKRSDVRWKELLLKSCLREGSTRRGPSRPAVEPSHQALSA